MFYGLRDFLYVLLTYCGTFPVCGSTRKQGSLFPVSLNGVHYKYVTLFKCVMGPLVQYFFDRWLYCIAKISLLMFI